MTRPFNCMPGIIISWSYISIHQRMSMMRPSSRAMLASLLLILSSLAGCVGTEDLEGDGPTESLGTVVVSTYHVEQLVTAVGGGLVDVQLISTGNIPVHDYTPTAQDLIRLGEADLFLYHGLGLEPWVNATLESMGDDAPAAAMTHAMPSGQSSLDYETILIDQLCDSLNGAMETVDLTEEEDDAPEFDGDNAAYTLELPHHDEEGHDMDDHDEDHHDEDDHDEEHHDEEGEHDEHDEHDHLEAEETLDASSTCPTGTVINLYHFEPGHYVLEFEAEDMEMFNVAIAMMGGAHNHAHDHDEEDHDEDDHDEDDHDEDDHDEDGHDEDDHDEHDHDEDDHMDDMSAEEMFNEVDTNNDSMVTWEELSAWMLDGHDDDHDDDHHDENATSSGNESGNGTADGNATADDDDHDHGHDEDEHDHEMEEIEMALEYAMIEHMFDLSDANDDGSLDLTEFTSMFDRVEAMEDDMPDLDTMAAVFMAVFDENDDGMLSAEEFTELAEFMMMDEGDEHHDDEHDHGNESGDEDHEEMNLTETVNFMMMMFDANNDSSLNLEELEMFMSMGMEEDHHEVAFMKLDIEVEGEYGIALPEGVMMHIIPEGDHDGHDHGAHDEEGAHDEDDDEEGDHDEEGHDEEGHDEALAYDPHSWLDPLAFKAQVGRVADLLSTSFPDGAETFAANAAVYVAALEAVDDEFEAAFGDNGTCEVTPVASNHNAYAYLSARYGLEFVTVHGLDPEGEPTAEDIAEVVAAINEDNITVIFIEEYTDADAVQSIVEQTGVTPLTLYTMELPPMNSDDTYASLMQSNLMNLKTGLGCQ